MKCRFLAAVGFRNLTHTQTLSTAVSRVGLYSLTRHSSGQSLKHFLSCFVREDLFIAVFLRHISTYLRGEVMCHRAKSYQLLESVTSLPQCSLLPCSDTGIQTESLWTFAPPRPPTHPLDSMSNQTPSCFVANKELLAFCYQSSCLLQLCAFSSM